MDLLPFVIPRQYSYDEECTSMVYSDQKVPACSYNNQQVSVTGLEGRFL